MNEEKREEKNGKCVIKRESVYYFIYEVPDGPAAHVVAASTDLAEAIKHQIRSGKRKSEMSGVSWL